MTDGLPGSAPAPAAGPLIDIRRYPTIEAFQADAAAMAAAGWQVVAQSEASAGMNGGWVAVAVILFAIGLFLISWLLIVAVLVLILAAVNGQKQFVVTYRPGTIGS